MKHAIEDSRSNGYSAKELAEGLSHLAINGTNKKILVNKGAVRVFNVRTQNVQR